MDGSDRYEHGDPGNALMPQPVNYEAERALLGAMLMNNRAYDRVSDFLRPEHFADPANGRIYELAGLMVAKGENANPITLKAVADSDDVVIAAGGMKYLASLVAGAVSVINAVDYAKIILDLFLRRELIATLEDGLDSAYRPDPDVTAAALIEKTETQLMGLSAGDTEGGFKAFREHAHAAVQGFELAYKHKGEIIGLPTGLVDIDRKLGGLWARNLLIIGGRPGMGKTSLITTMLFNIGHYLATTEREDHKGGCAAVFSLEMGGEELAARIICARANVSFEDSRLGKIDQEQMTRLITVAQELSDLPIYIDDTPALSVGRMVSRARRLSRKLKIKVAFIDYLGLTESDDPKANRTQQLGQVTRGCKKMAKALDLPVVALAQLSRKVEERDDKRPQMADLRDSGEIEEHADSVAFIFRAQYYLERNEPKRAEDEGDIEFTNRYAGWQRAVEEARNKAEFIIAKNRHGQTGTVKLHFDGEKMQFGDLFDDPLAGDDPMTTPVGARSLF